MIPFSQLKVGERGVYDFGDGSKATYQRVDDRFFNRIDSVVSEECDPPGGILVTDKMVTAYFNQDKLMVTRECS